MRVVYYLLLFLMMASSAVFSEPLATKHDALSRALAYTGLSAVSDTTELEPEQCVVATKMTDSIIPFLAGEAFGREVWKVTLDSVYLNLSNWHPDLVANQPPKRFEIIIDKETGTLYQVIGIPVSRSGPPPKDMPAGTAEKRMRGEVYHSFPAETPPVPLLRAFSQAAVSRPLDAEKVTVFLVNYSKMGGEVFPAWVIIGHGVEEIPIFGGHLTGMDVVTTYGSQRSVVNAITGEAVAFTNRPYGSGAADTARPERDR
jgi:hypothetical protein